MKKFAQWCGKLFLSLVLVLALALSAWAGALTYYCEGKILDHTLKTAAYTPAATVYLGLSTADPTQDGTGWVDPTYTGYGRKAITFAAASARSIAQSGAVTFDQCTGGSSTVGWYGVWDAPTGGNLLAEGALAAPKNIVAGNTPSMASGQVTISFNAGAIFTSYANTVLDWVFRNQTNPQPTNIQLALSTTNPADDGTGITEPIGYNYSRLTFNTWNAASGTPRLADNNGAATWPTPSGSWGNCKQVVVYGDANPRFYGTFTAQDIGSGDTVQYLTGDLDIIIN